MAVRGLILAVTLAGLVAICCGEVFLSQLPKTLTVTTSPSGQVNLQAGKDSLTVTWKVDSSQKNIDTSSYKTVNVNLCYLPESQTDRPWRKPSDNLKKDKSCQHKVTSKPYSGTDNSVTYKVERDVPTAHYYVRAYVLDGSGKQVAYGQTSDDRITITAITGRHVSIDIAAGVFSAFSIAALAGFFYREKKKAKMAA